MGQSSQRPPRRRGGYLVSEWLQSGWELTLLVVPLLESLASKVGLNALWGWVSRVRMRWKRGAAGIEEDRQYVLDFATGLGQATMALRDAVAYFERNSVLVDPDYGTLVDTQIDLTREASRTVDQAEARLPRVQVVVGFDSAPGRAGREAVHCARESFERLNAYVRQPGEGDEWSFDDREAARVALTDAESARDDFLRAVRNR
jgi:hypothetical protein